ncbi:uncharacterized protein [Rhodnius prolixus]|uniref:uncharacterized protein n=1 Tax=Rhodnius prolixus TaxID=13249 RepID=UPI003D18B2E8
MEGRCNVNVYRNSKDLIVNNRGKMFLETCDNCNLIVLNGRTAGDEGQYTYISGRGCSVCDLCTLAFDLLHIVKDFRVIPEVFSDHMPINLIIKLDPFDKQDKLLPLLPKLPWTELDRINFKNKLEKSVNLIKEVPNNVQGAVDMFVDMIVQCSSLGKRVRSIGVRSSTNFKQKWHDNDCKQARNKTFKLLNLFRKTGLKLVRSTYSECNSQYKQLCASKKKEFYLSLKNKFKEVNDTKNLWSLIKHFKSSNFVSSAVISCEDWVRHFNNLLNPCLSVDPIQFAPPLIEGGVRVAGVNIRCLLYADDIVVMADHPSILQSMINRMSAYCDQWNLNLNLEKSKIIVFKNGGRQAKNERWSFKGIKIENVRIYKYLGMYMIPKLSFSHHFREKLSVAKFALNVSYGRLLKSYDVPFSTKHEVFRAVARAIICYGAQIWGFQRYDSVERLYTFFVKKIFFLPKNTPHYIIYLETGAEPMFLFTLKMFLKNIKSVLSLPDQRLPKLLVKEIVKKKIYWYDACSSLFAKFNFDFDKYITGKDGVDSLNGLFEKINQEFKDECLKKAFHSTFHSLYKELKLSLDKHYISDDNNFYLMSNIFKARGQLLKLNYNITRTEAQHYCSMCNLGAVENVYHFIAVCPIMREFRVRCFGKVELSMAELIDQLNGKDWLLLNKFIRSAGNYRKMLIQQFNY